MDAEHIASLVGGVLGTAVALVAGAKKALDWLGTPSGAARNATPGRAPTIEERVGLLEGSFEKMKADVGPLVKKAADEAIDEAALELVRRMNAAAKKAQRKEQGDGRDDEGRRSSGA